MPQSKRVGGPSKRPAEGSFWQDFCFLFIDWKRKSQSGLRTKIRSIPVSHFTFPQKNKLIHYFPLSISEIALLVQVHLDKQVSYKERASLKRISEALFILVEFRILPEVKLDYKRFASFCSSTWASITAMVTMFKMSRTVLSTFRMWIGLFNPICIGPMVSLIPFSSISL